MNENTKDRSAPQTAVPDKADKPLDAAAVLRRLGGPGLGQVGARPLTDAERLHLVRQGYIARYGKRFLNPNG